MAFTTEPKFKHTNRIIEWLLMLGVQFDQHSFFNVQCPRLLMDRSMVYRLPGTGWSSADLTADYDPLTGSVTEKTVLVDDFERFEFITANLRDNNNPEFAFGVRTRDGDLIYLTERDAERIYSGRMSDGRDFNDLLSYICMTVRRNYEKNDFMWPHGVSQSLSEYLHPSKVIPGTLNPTFMAERILNELKLPFLVGDRVLQPRAEPKIEIPEIEPKIDELRKLNPNYGVLKF